mmetsp:Transcript_19313/g.29620  ORF Transcript_19313/g.29620 Transcript_19313/m.29620 type:complete len:104 (+) Transcript_19313:236-547(+)
MALYQIGCLLIKFLYIFRLPRILNAKKLEQIVSWDIALNNRLFWEVKCANNKLKKSDPAAETEYVLKEIEHLNMFMCFAKEILGYVQDPQFYFEGDTSWKKAS